MALECLQRSSEPSGLQGSQSHGYAVPSTLPNPDRAPVRSLRWRGYTALPYNGPQRDAPSEWCYA